MIAEMMQDMRAEYERREEALHREIARLRTERDDALSRAQAPAKPARCKACGAAVALLALLVAALLPAQRSQTDAECAARLSACGDEVQAMRDSLVVADLGDYAEDVCDLEGVGGYE